MSDSMLTSERNVLLQVIRMYKDNPCLWDKKHPQYGNREIRGRAYNLLLEKYRTVYEGASLHVMKRKIDSLRTSYKRENKKMVESKARGDDPCYTPTLWYFNALKFIEYEFSNESTNSLDPSTDCEDNEDDSSHKPTSRLSNTDSNHQQETLEEEYVDENEEVYEIQYYSKDTQDEPKPKKPNLATVFMADEGSNREKKDKVEIHVTDSCLKKSHQGNSIVEESESFGRTVGLQLQQLDGFQRTVAEKLISEVIFYARLNKLSAHSFFNLNADKYN